MRNLEKTKLLLIPFLLGLVLFSISWHLSYPLSVDSVDDFVFNHVSVLYWVSLSLLLTSLFMMGVAFKDSSYKWIIAVGIVLIIYSISYFYVMLPGSDSQYFRGLTEYFTETKNLDPSQANHSYYQWPSFFILSYIVSSVCGLSLVNYEFLLYTIIGFLLAVSLYSYAFKAYGRGGFLAVPVFFISMFTFLNYQCVPFSLALGLLFLLFMLETWKKSVGLTVAIIVLFGGIVITHLFVPLFFIIYLLMQAIISKKRHYANLFLFALTLYFVIQFTMAQYSFELYIRILLTASSEYSSVIETTAVAALNPIDVIAQTFSRLVTVAFAAISGIGFLFLLIKKKLRDIDKAILLTGILYSGIGIFLAALGTRAISLAFIPVSLGAAFLFEKASRPFLKHIFVVLIVVLLALFSFIPLHQSFNSATLFQTQETYRAANFLIDYSDWEETNQTLSYHSVNSYFEAKLSYYKVFTAYLQDVKDPDIVFYTVGLGKELLSQNYTVEQIFFGGRRNLVYTNGFSSIATKAQY